MSDAGRQTQGMKIVVKRFEKISDIENCHILFVSANYTSSIKSISANPSTKSSLIITDQPGMASSGSTINFIEDQGKMKFELNQSNADKRGLKVAGTLAALSILV